uniref:LOW QUALITY PROTEIN: collagen alpha-4(VI) chain-like n=1 Tax=Myxine glutinosa TaxID=7769 RepID=UPI00358F6486
MWTPLHWRLWTLTLLASSRLAVGQRKECSRAAKADLIFLIDGSWSIGNTNFEMIRSFLFTLVKGLDVGPDKVQVGMVQYSTDPRTEFLLKTYSNKMALLDRIRKFSYKGGSTNTGLGIEFLMQNHLIEAAGSRKARGVPQVVIVVTDGESQDDVEKPSTRLQYGGVKVYVIGIKNANKKQLDIMASKPTEKFVYFVKDFSALGSITDGVLQTVCKTVEEEVATGDRSKYADVVFLVDGSGSTSKLSFESMKQVVGDLLRTFDVSLGRTQVAMVQTTRSNARAEFLLGTQTSRDMALQSVDRVPLRGGAANMGQALNFVENNVLSDGAGGRAAQGFPQVVIVLIGRKSQDRVQRTAESLKDAGTEVFVVGAGDADITEMKEMGSLPSNLHVFYKNNFKDYLGNVDEVLDSLSTVIDLTRGLRLDVAFLIDSSDSMGQQGFRYAQELASRVTSQLDVGEDAIRIGFAQYARSPQTEFDLRQYTSNPTMENGIRRIHYRGGHGANLGAAVLHLTKHLLSESGGARIKKGVPSVAVLIVGSPSSDGAFVAALELQRSGIGVVVVVTGRAKHQEMQVMVDSAIAGRLFQQPRIELVPELGTPVAEAIRKLTKRQVMETGCEYVSQADIAFLVHQPWSTGPTNFDHVRQFLSTFVENLLVGPNALRIALVLYSTEATTEFLFNSYSTQDNIIAHIRRLPYKGGQTSTGLALRHLSERVFIPEAGSRKAQGVPQIAIVITNEDSPSDVIHEAKKLQQMGVGIYSIGISRGDMGELREIATGHDDTYISYVEDFDHLQVNSMKIMNSVCTMAVDIEEKTLDVTKDVYDWAKLSFRAADIAFLIDGSNNARPVFKDIAQFVKKSVDNMNIGRSDDEVQVALARYGKNPRTVFRLNSHDNKQKVQHAIRRLETSVTGGPPNLEQGLRLIRDQVFTKSAGSRAAKGIPQILVVVAGDHKLTKRVQEMVHELTQKGIIVYALVFGKKAGIKDITSEVSHSFLEESYNKELLYRFLWNMQRTVESNLGPVIDGIHKGVGCKDVEETDIVFVIDSSSRVLDISFERLRRFVYSIVSRLPWNQQVNVWIVQSGYRVSGKKTNTFEDATNYLKDMEKIGGEFKTGAALTYIKDSLLQVTISRPQVLVVLMATPAADSIEEPSNVLKDGGVAIIPIGLQDADDVQMGKMNSGMMYRLEGKQEYSEILREVSVLLCAEMENTMVSKTKRFFFDFLMLVRQRPEYDLACGILDMVILLDTSNSVSDTDFQRVRTFLASLMGKLEIGPDNVRVGMAQYNKSPQKQFFQNEYTDRDSIKDAVSQLKRKGDGTETRTGEAVAFLAKNFFKQEVGSRIDEGIPQYVLVITDGESHDTVSKGAEELHKLNVTVIAVGVGKKLEKIIRILAKPKNNTFFVHTFDQLLGIEKQIGKNMCPQLDPTPPATPPPPPPPPGNCTVDAIFAVDISEERGDGSISSRLTDRLSSILKLLADATGLSCPNRAEAMPVVRFGLLAQSAAGVARKVNLRVFEDSLAQEVSDVLSQGTSYLTGKSLSDILVQFQGDWYPGSVKVVFLLSDGLDEDLQNIELASQKLRLQGIDGLVTVALQDLGHSWQNLNRIEFGRGSRYRQRITMSLPNAGQEMADELVNIVLRECCNIPCRCTGEYGRRGLQGSRGPDGITGKAGYSGHPGEEGGMGPRGSPGLNGTRGFQGCQGIRGLKGARGRVGTVGGLGEQAVDGINGEPGVAGLPGISGQRGFPGGAGVRGSHGFNGERGRDGIRGDPGEPGLDAGEPGAKGEIGAIGPMGRAGKPGGPGGPGGPGAVGFDGKRGFAGDKGNPGILGPDGSPGADGSAGSEGEQGPIGNPGPDGERGKRGPIGKAGLRGEDGDNGKPGKRGRKGPAGLEGNPGVAGNPGPRAGTGVDGQDTIGIHGSKGDKGEPGFPGYAGSIGDDGNPGPPGDFGGTGVHGRPGNAGISGSPGTSGDPGAPGFMGQKGQPGLTETSRCNTLELLRNNCPCCQGKLQQPVYPTELVLAMDSNMVPEAAPLFSFLVEQMHLAYSTCPRGARIALMKYGPSGVSLELRLGQEVQQTAILERLMELSGSTTAARGRKSEMGQAMMHVARHSFKRVRSGPLLQRVAVFVTREVVTDEEALRTGVAMLAAAGVTTVVLAFKNAPDIEEAMKIDDRYGRSVVVVIPPGKEEQREALLSVIRCNIGYDMCRPHPGCPHIPFPRPPVELGADVAFFVDTWMDGATFETSRRLLDRALEMMTISERPRRDPASRVALVRFHPGETSLMFPSPWASSLVLNHTGATSMRHYVKNDMRSNGVSPLASLAQILPWSAEHMFKDLPLANAKRQKVAVILLGNSFENRLHITEMALQARCQGLPVVALGLGPKVNGKDLSVLASSPLPVHNLLINTRGLVEEDYAAAFLRAFFSALSHNMFDYSPRALTSKCGHKNFQNDQSSSSIKMSRHKDSKKDDYNTPEVVIPATPEDERSNGQRESASRMKAVDPHYHSGSKSSRNPVNIDPSRGVTQNILEPEVRLSFSSGKTMLKKSMNYLDINMASQWEVGETPEPVNSSASSFIITTKEQATSRPQPDRCHGRFDSGLACREFRQFWYFDQETDSCRRFWYGGCGGNGNRFASEEECFQFCLESNVNSLEDPTATPVTKQPTKQSSKGSAHCLLPRSAGRCYSYKLKWYYNRKEHRCTHFWYGGCRGNANRFSTKSRCEQSCRHFGEAHTEHTTVLISCS